MKMNAKNFRHSDGFTLMELLIVIVIMGVLLAAGLSSYTTTLMKSRDNRRKANLRSIAQALEAYYSDKSKYPNQAADGSGAISGCGIGDAQVCTWNGPLTDSKGTTYMQKLPMDPSNGLRYFYIVGNGNKSYQLYTKLENTQDSDIPHNGSTAQSYPSTNCSSGASLVLCNYGVASSNTTPETGRTPL